MIINKTTTYKELKAMVGSTKGLVKLPTAKELRNSNEEIVFEGDAADAHFIIYKNGLFIYSRNGYATVYAVDRCSKIKFENTYDKEYGPSETSGCKCQIYGDGRMVSFVPEEKIQDGSWIWPLDAKGSERLIHNSDSREQSHIDISLNNDGTDWESKATVPNFVDELEALERGEELCEKLEKAMKKLTDKQRQVIQYSFYAGTKQTQATVAEKMGCKQPMVHKHMDAAIKNLRKEMGL